MRRAYRLPLALVLVAACETGTPASGDTSATTTRSDSGAPMSPETLARDSADVLAAERRIWEGLKSTDHSVLDTLFAGAVDMDPMGITLHFTPRLGQPGADGLRPANLRDRQRARESVIGRPATADVQGHVRLDLRWSAAAEPRVRDGLVAAEERAVGVARSCGEHCPNGALSVGSGGGTVNAIAIDTLDALCGVLKCEPGELLERKRGRG